MNSKFPGNRFKTIAAITVVCLFMFSNTALADSRRRQILAFNVIGTSIFTCAAAAVQGNLKDYKDVLAALGYGALGGYGFFESRNTIGRGHVAEGVALSYLSSSVVENVSLGENPLAYLRYGTGPLELRLATPLAWRPNAWISLDADPIEVATFALFCTKIDEIGFKDGLIYGIENEEILSDEIYAEDPEDLEGSTLGRHIIIERRYLDRKIVWRHEAIHVTQNIQYGSIFARPQKWFESDRENDDETRIIGLGYRLEWVALVEHLVERNLFKYDDRWSEFEAYELATDRD